MKKCIAKLFYGKAGFSVIELLVVIAVLGALAAVAGVNIGKYIGQGKTEAYATELQDILPAVAAMLHDSSAGQLDSNQININDMDLVTADSGSLVLSNYLERLDENGVVPSGCRYSFTVNGTVTQISTP
ncbi:prepilin-type N-terminal cleavage/methylation domain-containing protein [Chloroflexota bacterium]